MTKLWTATAPAFRESGDWPRQGLRTRQDRRSRPARRNLERAMAVAVVPREDNAFANDNPPPARNAVLARYRQLREISKRHHHDILKLISGDAMLQQARQLGLGARKDADPRRHGGDELRLRPRHLHGAAPAFAGDRS